MVKTNKMKTLVCASATLLLCACSMTQLERIGSPSWSKVPYYQVKQVRVNYDVPLYMGYEEALKHYQNGAFPDMTYELNDANDQLNPTHYQYNPRNNVDVVLNHRTVNTGAQTFFQGIEAEYVPYLEYWLLRDVQRRMRKGEFKPMFDLHYRNNNSAHPNNEFPFEDTFESFEYYRARFIEYMKDKPNENMSDEDYVKYGDNAYHLPLEIRKIRSGNAIYHVLSACFPSTFRQIYGGMIGKNKYEKNYWKELNSIRSSRCDNMMEFFPFVDTGKRIRFARNLELDEYINLDMGKLELSVDFWMHFFSTNLFDSQRVDKYGGVFGLDKEITYRRVMRASMLNFSAQGAKHRLYSQKNIQLAVDGMHMFGKNLYVHAGAGGLASTAVKRAPAVFDYRGSEGARPMRNVFGYCVKNSEKTMIAFQYKFAGEFLCQGKRPVRKISKEDPSVMSDERILLRANFLVGLINDRYLKARYNVYDENTFNSLTHLTLTEVGTTQDREDYVGQYQDKRMNLAKQKLTVRDWLEAHIRDFPSFDMFAYIDIIDNKTVGVVYYYGYRIFYDLSELAEFKRNKKSQKTSPDTALNQAS